MTTEEKAKAYDEALERAKQKHGKFSEFVTKTIEEIFPELRESEDERIRKAIRLVLIATEDEQKDFYSTHGLTRKDCTNWLEKQKEQDDKGLSEKIAAAYQLGRSDERKQKEPEVQVFCEAKAYDLGYEQGKEDAKKEQKPSWSEEDQDKINTILGVLHLIGNYNFDSWLKSIRPSWKPSEEQMKALQSARFLYRDGLENSATASALESLYIDLKKL